jgi:hypothetical protein
MKVYIVTPAPARSRTGNRVTAIRWARILSQLGHRVTTTTQYLGERCDLMVALHAHRSHASIVRFKQTTPRAPLVVALTGTDLYRDLTKHRDTVEALEVANRLITLQPNAADALPRPLRRKVHVIYQSAEPLNGTVAQRKRTFDVCVIGHLRDVKDPLRAALAVRRLPSSSRIRILQVGEALDPGFAQKALVEMERNPRYQWLGPKPHGETRRILRS